MDYHGGNALGLVETVGMVPAVAAADRMLKAGAVELAAYENLGSTLVTVIVTGDVAAVTAAVDAGAAMAGSIGKLTAHNVMARPISAVGDIVAVHGVEETEESNLDERARALGLLETFGLVYILEAADAMCKAADVQLIGYENVASGYISVLVSGDVGACKMAVEAGRRAVAEKNAEVYSSVVIANPHGDLQKVTSLYTLDKLLSRA